MPATAGKGRAKRSEKASKDSNKERECNKAKSAKTFQIPSGILCQKFISECGSVTRKACR